MRNFFFYPIAHDIIDNISPVSIDTQQQVTKSTQTDYKCKSYSLIYNIPFFNTLFYPNAIQSYKIIFYYQTFSSLDPIIKLKKKINSNIYVYISSFHFGKKDNELYIKLNNNSIDEQGTLWDDAIKAYKNNINIMIMLDGIYSSLFSKFDAYYNLLYEFLNDKRYITGIDIDIHEIVRLDDIKLLITRLKKDFGNNFIITMSPSASSMIYDMPGIGNFIYKDLYNSDEGKYINWYNVQSYDEYTFDIYDSIIKNGYTPDKIGFGLLGNNFNSNSMITASNELSKIKLKYPNITGCTLWEYGETNINPIEWAIQI